MSAPRAASNALSLASVLDGAVVDVGGGLAARFALLALLAGLTASSGCLTTTTTPTPDAATTRARASVERGPAWDEGRRDERAPAAVVDEPAAVDERAAGGAALFDEGDGAGNGDDEGGVGVGGGVVDEPSGGLDGAEASADARGADAVDEGRELSRFYGGVLRRLRQNMRAYQDVPRPPDPPIPILPGWLVAALGGPVEPARSSLGSDVSTLPARFPEAAWLPLRGPTMALQADADVVLDGKPVRALLDTGAARTFVTLGVARRLGLSSSIDVAKRRELVDAHGQTAAVWALPLRTVALGPAVVERVEAAVSSDEDAPDLVLVGFDVLRRFDLYVAADEGLLGLFPPGRAPTGGMAEVRVEDAGAALVVEGRAAGARADAAWSMIVDTGASQTVVPLVVGLDAGLPADLAFQDTAVGAFSSDEKRGRFVLAPLRLGPSRHAVDDVRAWGGGADRGESLGLLGMDVLAGHRTVISPSRGALFLSPLPARPPWRERGPAGEACFRGGGKLAVPCIRVSLDRVPLDVDVPGWARDDYCVRVEVDAAYRSRTFELAIVGRAVDGRRIFGGGAMLAYVTVGRDGHDGCAFVPRGSEHLGLDHRAQLTIQWVRAEGFDWPCHPSATHCTLITGALARPGR